MGELVTGSKRQPAEGEREFLGILALGAGLEIPGGFLECWHWIKAIHAHDFGDPQPLAELVKAETDIPPNVREVLADIVSGKRAPAKKKLAHLKIKGKDRLAAAMGALFNSQLRQRMASNAQYMADGGAMEPAELLEWLSCNHQDWQQRVCERYGIGRDALDDLRRELENLIKDWPNL